MTRLALPILRPVDGNGQPYPNGTLNFYDAGSSTTPKTVYSDSTMLVSLGSQVTADGEGLFTDIYYSGDIRVVLKDSNGVIQSTKDLYGAGNVTSGDLAADSVTTVKILDANVTLAKLVTLDNAKIITSNGSANSQVAISGDVSMTNTGAMTVSAKLYKATGEAGTNSITCTSVPVQGSLVDRAIITIVPANTTTSTAVTFAPDGLTAHNVKKYNGSDLDVGDLRSGMPCMLQYYSASTEWRLINPYYGFRKYYAGSVTNNGSVAWSGTVPNSGSDWTLSRASTGDVTVTHNLGLTDYRVIPSIIASVTNSRSIHVKSKSANSFSITTKYAATNLDDDLDFDFILIRA